MLSCLASNNCGFAQRLSRVAPLNSKAVRRRSVRSRERHAHHFGASHDGVCLARCKDEQGVDFQTRSPGDHAAQQINAIGLAELLDCSADTRFRHRCAAHRRLQGGAAQLPAARLAATPAAVPPSVNGLPARRNVVAPLFTAHDFGYWMRCCFARSRCRTGRSVYSPRHQTVGASDTRRIGHPLLPDSTWR